MDTRHNPLSILEKGGSVYDRMIWNGFLPILMLHFRNESTLEDRIIWVLPNEDWKKILTEISGACDWREDFNLWLQSEVKIASKALKSSGLIHVSSVMTMVPEEIGRYLEFGRKEELILVEG